MLTAPKAKWTRLAGLGALLALALTGAWALGTPDHGPHQHQYALCLLLLVLLVQTNHPHGALPDLAEAGRVVEAPAPRLVTAFLRLRPSRGPPA